MKKIEFFLGADMRCSHQGLILMAKTKGVHFDKLHEGDALIFVNGAKDRVKALSANGVLSYLNLEGKRKIDLAAIEELPKAFNRDGSLDYPKALKATLEKKLGTKYFNELQRL